MKTQIEFLILILEKRIVDSAKDRLITKYGGEYRIALRFAIDKATEILKEFEELPITPPIHYPHPLTSKSNTTATSMIHKFEPIIDIDNQCAKCGGQEWQHPNITTT